MREHFDPFWHGGAAALLLVALGLAMFFYVYLPAQAAHLELQRELQTAHARQAQKESIRRALREKNQEIENGDLETISEIIREQLLKGKMHEYFGQTEK